MKNTMIAQQPTQAEFKKFERLFNKIRAAKAANRREATGTLTPAVRRRHLASGAPLDLLFGIKPNGMPFTVEDLKRFDKRAQARRKQYGAGKKGVSADQLIAVSRADDIERSRKQVKNATLYRIANLKSGVHLHWRASAGPNSEYTYHQVKIRLEEWSEWLDNTSIKFSQAAKNILNGRISFDCDCGRHQYWYRYVATIGGFAVSPLERAYPKIRNPKLTGACCKHVLKVLATLRGPAVQQMIIAEMKKDAERIGFGDDRSAAHRFLNKDELQKATRSSWQMKLDQKTSRGAFRNYLRAKTGIKEKLKEPKSVEALDKLRAEKEAYKHIAKKELETRKAVQKRADRAERDLLLANLNTHMMASIYRDKMTRGDAIKAFARANEMPLAEVEKLSENINL